VSHKVYDCVLYNGEWELLALRINELQDKVARFYIFESTFTFTGQPKQITFDQDNPYFHEFADRIEHVVNDRNNPDWSPWEREENQRNFIGEYVSNLGMHDFVLLSDVDEVPFASSLDTVVGNDSNAIFALEMSLHYFAFDYQCLTGPELNSVWACVFQVAELNKFTTNELRSKVRNGEINALRVVNAGQHLSYFMSEALLKEKLNSFSHQELNNDYFRMKLNPAYLISDTVDPFDRSSFGWGVIRAKSDFEFVNSNPDLYQDFFTSSILSNSMSRLRSEIEAQRYEIEAQMINFTRSLSWRITLPLRNIDKMFRQMRARQSNNLS
jgi:hypothetical protein